MGSEDERENIGTAVAHVAAGRRTCLNHLYSSILRFRASATQARTAGHLVFSTP